jgi:hypothetical protein
VGFFFSYFNFIFDHFETIEGPRDFPECAMRSPQDAAVGLYLLQNRIVEPQGHSPSRPTLRPSGATSPGMCRDAFIHPGKSRGGFLLPGQTEKSEKE